MRHRNPTESKYALSFCHNGYAEIYVRLRTEAPSKVKYLSLAPVLSAVLRDRGSHVRAIAR